jgi:hypothetical protein
VFVSSLSTLSLTLSTHIFRVPVIGRRALDNFVRCENKPSMLRRGKICQYANKFYQRGSTPEPLAALLTRFSANLTLEKSKTEQIAANARPFVVFNGPRFSWLTIAVRSLAGSPTTKIIFGRRKGLLERGKETLVVRTSEKEGSRCPCCGGDVCRRAVDRSHWCLNTPCGGA